ncbi:MAG: aspartate ammonia-lyase [Bacteroidales bacterium]|nr:aspartate ammonia-lyase [Bacteroidales bacterium]
MANKEFRTESDLLGSKEVPADAYYGVQTQRAIENFQISGRKLSDFPNFVKGLAITKKAAAIANGKVNMITNEQSEAIQFACDEILAGKYIDQFPVDMIQGGAGTSTNMCANEVIANIALEHMGFHKGEYTKGCMPNDTVNGSQSTNDAYPCSIHMGLYLEHLELIEHLELLAKSLEKKADEFKNIVKMGRTQLQDAVPMTLGQTFGGFASTIRLEMENLNHAAQEFLTHNMGATAIGTGICAFPGYSALCNEALRKITGWNVKLADNLIEATSSTACLVQYSGAMKRLSLRINKICNDLRLMGSGPRCGLAEIHLPERQPGSSIMPGKVNPVIPEVMNQINYKVIGNDTCVAMGCDNAQLELNVMEPVMTYACFESVHLLMNGVDTLRTLCIDGIVANEKRCNELVENSIGIVTMLNPYIGYKQATKVAKEALETGRGVKELVLEHGYLTLEQYEKIMRPENMLEPVFVEGVPLNH